MKYLSPLLLTLVNGSIRYNTEQSDLISDATIPAGSLIDYLYNI